MVINGTENQVAKLSFSTRVTQHADDSTFFGGVASHNWTQFQSSLGRSAASIINYFANNGMAPNPEKTGYLLIGK